MREHVAERVKYIYIYLDEVGGGRKGLGQEGDLILLYHLQPCPRPCDLESPLLSISGGALPQMLGNLKSQGSTHLE